MSPLVLKYKTLRYTLNLKSQCTSRYQLAILEFKFSNYIHNRDFCIGSVNVNTVNTNMG